MYISILLLTIYELLFSSPLIGLFIRNPLRIAPNIISNDRYGISGIHIILNLLNNLGVTSFLPPVGGPQAATKIISLTFMNYNFYRS